MCSHFLILEHNMLYWIWLIHVLWLKYFAVIMLTAYFYNMCEMCSLLLRNRLHIMWQLCFKNPCHHQNLFCNNVLTGIDVEWKNNMCLICSLSVSSYLSYHFSFYIKSCGTGTRTWILSILFLLLHIHPIWTSIFDRKKTYHEHIKTIMSSECVFSS